MKYKIFVDGQEGTTGLKINERLENREDLEILKIDHERRKDPDARREFLNAADIVFLCLPDAASKGSVSFVTNNNTRIIDASTAFRTASDWTYGLPELSKDQRERVKNSNRVSVPGCHATGFNVAVYPLVKEGIISTDYPVTCHSITGYSGGGKKMIEQYENERTHGDKYQCPRFYGLGLTHKHLPEMQKISGLNYSPIFTPIVGDFAQGMGVAVPLSKRLMYKKMTAREVHEFMTSYYADERFVKVMPFDLEGNLDNGFFDPTACNNTNRLEIFVFGHEDQVLLKSRFDNLGKGASGAAVQNLNIMLGVDEGTGLEG